MQRRLTVALVGVAMAAILLVGVGVLLFAQVGARSEARDAVAEQLFALQTLANRGNEGSQPDLGPAIRRVGEAFGDGRTALGLVDRAGTLSELPQRGGLRAESITPPALTLGDTKLDELRKGELVLADAGRTVVGVVALSTSPDAGSPAPITVLWVQRDVGSIPNGAVRWFVGSTAIVLVASVLLAAWLARRFTEPVRTMQLATAAIADGRLETRIPITGTDELASLGQSVNTMAAGLGRARAAEQQFLLSITHDLRTPLTSITGYAEALIDGATTDTEGAARIIAGNADRLNRLVDDLLTLAKLESDAFTFNFTDIDLAQVAREQVQSAELHARSNDVSLDVFQPTPVLVHADADRVRQILDNLIENAVRYADTTVQVRITASDRARLFVDDDGPGIPIEDLPHVFDRLYVSALAPRRSENSSGLGLAIVHELVSSMGGTVRASRSTLGGTRITVELPGATR